MPQLTTETGQTMAQTQSIMRYLGSSYRGKNGECLYPGKANPDASYEIDEILEYANNFFDNYFKAIFKGLYDEDAVYLSEYCNGEWLDMLKYIERRIEKGDGKGLITPYLVGDCLTLADLALGALYMIIRYNPLNKSQEMFEK